MRKSLSSIIWPFYIALMLLAGSACAAPAETSASNAALDQRVLQLTEELRCLVCQNQTIADSHAELAVMLKKQVRDMLAQGMSDRQVMDFMVQRYGDFVLYRPPLKNTTWLLWFSPFLLLLCGLALLFSKLYRAQTDLENQTASDPASAARTLVGECASGVPR